MRARVLACLLLVTPLAGCSLAFTSGPPAEPERGAFFTCTTSYLAPVLDLAWAGYALTATAAEKSGGVDAGDLTLSAAWIGSAVHGIRNVRRCKAAIRRGPSREPPTITQVPGSVPPPGSHADSIVGWMTR